MNPRALITGSGGFIGSRLAIRCREAGHEVIATAHRASPELAQALGVSEVIPLDVLDPRVADLPLDADIIFHCATANDIVSRDFKPGVDLSVNGTRNVLELALRRGIRRVVFFSTLQVYGTELYGEITEGTPVRCESPYALNHLLGEEVCRFYANKHGMDIVLMRPSNVIGVPDWSSVQRSTLVPMCFVKEVLASGALTLRSSGHQRRNFVTSDQVSDACLNLMGNFPAGVTVVNAGSCWHASIGEMAALVADVFFGMTGQKLPVNFLTDEPLCGNEFQLYSRLLPREIVSRLFVHFKPITTNTYDRT
jgi:nucleoside-diphosphate-sugar epimerase